MSSSSELCDDKVDYLASLPSSDKGALSSSSDDSSICLLGGLFKLAMGTSSSDSEWEEEEEEDSWRVV